MKKTLIALAALAATGAFAQSTVQLYGAVDASYNHISQDGVTKNVLNNSQLGSSKLGFKGTEDLGGGLKANFKIEGGLANDSGNGKASSSNNQASSDPAALAGAQGLVFQRFAYVGLSGDFGEIRAGRDYVGAFLGAQAAVDPFGTNGPADSTNMALKLAANTKTGTNASNMIEYTTPNMSGFTVNIQHWFGENASNSAAGKSGDGTGVLASYANGPIFVSFGTQTTKFSPATAANGDYTLRSLSASYNFGPASLVYTYAHEGLAATTEATNNTNLIGVIVPVGQYSFKASYILGERKVLSAGKGSLLGLGVDYALSKRSKLYATYAHVTNKDGGASYNTGGIGSTTANNSSSNLAMGVFHAF